MQQGISDNAEKNQSIDDTQKSGANSESDNSTIILVVVIIVLLYILSLFFKNKCPKCKKNRALNEYDREFKGRTYVTENGKKVNADKIRAFLRCRYCGYETYEDRKEKVE